MASGDGPKTIKLRYAGICATCGATLTAGTRAVWDKAAGAAFCLSCAGATARPGASDVSFGDVAARPLGKAADPAPTPAGDMLPSVAGASSQAEADRRQQRRE